jgi:ABC-type phosphate transport system permease subunit
LVGFLMVVVSVDWAAQRGWTRRGWTALLGALLLAVTSLPLLHRAAAASRNHPHG